MVAVVGLGLFYELLREVATLTVNCKGIEEQGYVTLVYS